MTTENINIELDEPEELNTCFFTGVELDPDDNEGYESVHYRRDSEHGFDNDTQSHGWREVTDYVYYNTDEDFIHQCQDCGEYFHQALFNDDTDRCHGCDEAYSTCYRCDTEISNDDSYFDDAGDSYCSSCWEDHDENENNQSTRSIQSYSYKPNPVFGWVVESQLIRGLNVPRTVINEPMFGFELETNARDRSTVAKAADFLMAEAPDEYLYNKEDGTISAFEIVTHPFTLEAHKLLLPRQAISDLSSKYSLSSWSSVNGTGAGLHVHISKKSFAGASHQYKFQMFHYHNADLIKKFAGRDSERWATFRRNADPTDYSYDNMAEICKGNRTQNNRYSALNFQNRNTIELRYFRGSLKPETVLGVLEFCHSVHAYTKLLSVKEVANGHLAWGSYKMWLSEQSYEFLPSVLATRCV